MMNDNMTPIDMVPEKEELDALLLEFDEMDSIQEEGSLTALIRDDVVKTVSVRNIDTEPAIDRLMSMEGLETVKAAIRKQLCYSKIMSVRKELGFKAPNRIFNVILTGNPGTGKTTVARLIGEIFHEAGLLSKGHTVETNRAGLVGRYIGESEANTMARVAEARGGVLMIDEMYSLTSEVAEAAGESRDFGIKVIDTLMTVLSDPEADIVVIGCGYKENMTKFLKANPGLASRFPLVLDFEDFSAEQLWSIVRRSLNEFDFTVSKEGEAAIRSLISRAMTVRNFGNGRFAVTLVENHIIPALCSRIMRGWQGGMKSAARMRKLSVVRPADVPSFETLFPLAVKDRVSVGFR